MDDGASVGDIVKAMNRLGVSPKDLITILETIKAAGALHADLEVL
jgi:flagellar P-ring protein precursor FlgI